MELRLTDTRNDGAQNGQMYNSGREEGRERGRREEGRRREGVRLWECGVECVGEGWAVAVVEHGEKTEVLRE